MMFLNVTNPNDVAKLYPWLIPTETESRMDIACQLRYRMEKKPDDTFVLVAVDKGVTRAVLIAHVSDKNRKRVWVWQIKAEERFPYRHRMFDALKQWVEGKGCKQVRTSITSNKRWQRVLERRYGFKRRGTEMYCNVA
ncbi:MAG TPA: hypothetical protein HPP87_07150 [Planctomycetes bacterium]|nr:hypothetical protein [Planctomycetota bacterium]